MGREKDEFRREKTKPKEKLKQSIFSYGLANKMEF